MLNVTSPVSSAPHPSAAWRKLLACGLCDFRLHRRACAVCRQTVGDQRCLVRTNAPAERLLTRKLLRRYLYSDGIPEAMDGEMKTFSRGRAVEILAEQRHCDLERSIDSMVQHVERWCGEKGPLDDISLLGVEFKVRK